MQLAIGQLGSDPAKYREVFVMKYLLLNKSFPNAFDDYYSDYNGFWVGKFC